MDKGKGRAVDLDDLDDDIQASSSSSSKSYLASLNAAQTEAVTWSHKGGLQILAGPGSGKFLSSRVCERMVRVVPI